MKKEVQKLLSLCQRYCQLIESSCSDDEWLSKVASLLPKLHLAMVELVGVIDEDDLEQEGDLEKRFELYMALKDALGENDPYWMAFDMPNDAQQMSGSLADDLTDIYCELRRGLDSLKKGSESHADRVLGRLHQGYRIHWGQHLLDAERHLYLLEAEGRLRT
jgi:hypothetical protein